MSKSSDTSPAAWNSGISRFYSSLGLLVVLNLIIKPIWIFAIDRKVQLEVGQEEYGSYFALLNLSIILSFMLDLGFTNYFNRQGAFFKDNFIQHAGSFLLVKVLLAVLYAGIIVLIASLLGIDRWDILIPVMIIQVLTSMFLFFRAIITARQWFITDSWLSVLDKTLLILLCGSLLYFPLVFETITIGKFLFFQMTCIGLAAVSSLGILLRRGIGFHVSRFSFLGKTIWKDALPFGLVVLLMATHYRLDGFLLERLKGPGEAGLYAAAYRLLDAANMIGYLFASFLLPYLARQRSEGKKINAIVLNARHALLLYSTFIIIVTIFLSEWIGQLVYQDKIVNVTLILAWMIPALAGYSLVQVYGTVLTSSGHIRQLCLITLAIVVLNLLLNLVLIPVYGAKGACWSAIISQSLFGLATMFYCRKKLGVPIHIRSLMIYILTAICLSALFISTRNVSINPWILIGLAMIITTLFLLWIKPGIWNYWLKIKTSVS